MHQRRNNKTNYTIDFADENPTPEEVLAITRRICYTAITIKIQASQDFRPNPKIWYNFGQLRNLDISYTAIAYIGKSNMPNLEVFIANYCANLVNLPNSIYQIKRISIAYSGITDWNFDIYPKLVELDISNTELSDIGTKLSQLEKLTATFSKLAKLPEMPKLSYLDISETAISELPIYPELKYLACMNTAICEIPLGIPKLESILCIGSQIHAIPISQIYKQLLLNAPIFIHKKIETLEEIYFHDDDAYFIDKFSKFWKHNSIRHFDETDKLIPQPMTAFWGEEEVLDWADL
jgi:Leucine-rich repeat (LRR) protein